MDHPEKPLKNQEIATERNLIPISAILEEPAVKSNHREVLEIKEIQHFLESQEIGPGTKVCIIGSGEPSGFFWKGLDNVDTRHIITPDNVSIHTKLGWERLLFDTGAQLEIYEPDSHNNKKWQDIAIQLKPKVDEDSRINVPSGYESRFQNSTLADASADVIVFMNLFGTPMLSLNHDESNEITEKIAKVLKPGGLIICGDTNKQDRPITDNRLIDMVAKGPTDRNIYSIYRAKNTSIPWVAYEY